MPDKIRAGLHNFYFAMYELSFLATRLNMKKKCGPPTN